MRINPINNQSFGIRIKIAPEALKNPNLKKQFNNAKSLATSTNLSAGGSYTTASTTASNLLNPPSSAIALSGVKASMSTAAPACSISADTNMALSSSVLSTTGSSLQNTTININNIKKPS